MSFGVVTWGHLFIAFRQRVSEDARLKGLADWALILGSGKAAGEPLRWPRAVPGVTGCWVSLHAQTLSPSRLRCASRVGGRWDQANVEVMLAVSGWTLRNQGHRQAPQGCGCWGRGPGQADLRGRGMALLVLFYPNWCLRVECGQTREETSHPHPRGCGGAEQGQCVCPRPWPCPQHGSASFSGALRPGQQGCGPQRKEAEDLEP